MSILFAIFPDKYNNDNYDEEPFMEPKNRLGGGWVIGVIVGSLVAFALPLLIIVHISGLQTTSKELSTLASSTETTTPKITTTELQTTSKELSTLASSTETTTPMITTTELQTTTKEVSTSASSTETTIFMTTTAATSKSVSVCEDEMAHLQCLSNQMIVVENVFYGRNDNTTCPHWSLVNWQSNCSLAEALQVVSSRCLHLSDCSIQVSGVLFPDPCPNILKFFVAEYNCTDVTKKWTTVCENTAASLQCGIGERIDVVNAFYGRRDTTTCNDANIGSTTCSAANALALVSSKCNNSNSCNVPADGNYFGDPCAGVSKYLDIEYFCVA